MITALLVPADPARPVGLVEIADRARAYSDAIGGGLLDDTTTAVLAGGDTIALYLDEQRTERGLPDNPRAAILLTRLVLPDEALRAVLRGDLLITGLDIRGADTHVPPVVLARAVQAGIMPASLSARSPEDVAASRPGGP
ncbi:MAG: hypothetical protein HYR62_00795 [Actinobacteria bacterium]|nr:hypothetical protein [Actinomycetota bacterium]MBI3687900.1 hypothetical protein [Actinomycetota bacterium]